MNFQHKTVWITGASSGIGEALAYEFAKQGARLILSARNEGELRRVATACQGAEVILQPIDLADHEGLPAIVARVLEKTPVDILVNNAGLSQRSFAKDTRYEVDKRLLDVNLLGTITLSKALLPHFLSRRTGQFVIITSLMGKFGGPLRSTYAAAKHGLHGFFDSLRAEVWRENVGVTMVCPGFIRTKVSMNALMGDGTAQGTMDDATGKGMPPEVLAKKILRAVLAKREEVYFGGKEVWAVYLKRFFPRIFSKIIRKAKVT